ncbi:DUF2474 domain-containing protein [Methylophilus sp. UBA6697]|jgi:hypothetical protein|nr:DUF2474 domain-containing protein [Methylophilus sp. UBA6697]HCU84797.1 DUF2474 domain-containing protein [Methylophilus sp.]
MTHKQTNTLKRLGWFFLIWLASIAALAIVSMLLKGLMMAAGWHT